MIRNHLLRNESGATALEFAFAAPILFTFVVGIGQLGTIFFANTGLQHALAEGARVAAVYPTPADAEIEAAVVNRKFGYEPANLENVQLITKSGTGTNSDPYYYDLRLRYKVPFNLILMSVPITLDHKRRVYLQETPEALTNPPPTTTTPTPSNPSTPTTPTTPTTSGGNNSNGGGNGGGNSNGGGQGNGNGSSGNNAH